MKNLREPICLLDDYGNQGSAQVKIFPLPSTHPYPKFFLPGPGTHRYPIFFWLVLGTFREKLSVPSTQRYPSFEISSVPGTQWYPTSKICSVPGYSGVQISLSDFPEDILQVSKCHQRQKQVLYYFSNDK